VQSNWAIATWKKKTEYK